jgi:hypothetical protein
MCSGTNVAENATYGARTRLTMARRTECKMFTIMSPLGLVVKPQQSDDTQGGYRESRCSTEASEDAGSGDRCTRG